MKRVLRVGCWVLSAVLSATCWVLAAAQPTAKIDKPKPTAVSGGMCRLSGDGAVLGVNIGPNTSLPTLALTVGPSTMSVAMQANKAKFTGPGKYENEMIAVYLGKTALEDAYAGLGTVTINADGKSGTFALKDGKAAGTFDCGAVTK